MTLRERIERGTERRFHQTEWSELRRRTDKVRVEPKPVKPLWLRPAKDMTRAI